MNSAISVSQWLTKSQLSAPALSVQVMAAYYRRILVVVLYSATTVDANISNTARNGTFFDIDDL